MNAYEIGHACVDGGLLTAVTREWPAPGRGQVVLKVHATAINARDLTYAKFGGIPDQPPQKRVPLSDNASEVLAVGEGVETVRPGDRVIGCHYALWADGVWDPQMSVLDIGRTHDGYLSEQAMVPASCLVKIPDTLSYEDACTLPVAGLTAWRALVEVGKPKPGQVVLTLGAGGVSVFALQIGKMMGAQVIITSSSDEKLARMNALGADVTINYRTTPDWEKEVKAHTHGQGADVVLNTVGYGAVAQSLASCAPHATMVQIGGSRNDVEVKTLNPTVPWNLNIRGISNGSRRMLQDLVRAVEVNKLKPLIDRTFAFHDAPEAYRAMQAHEHVGKLVIKVAGDRTPSPQ